MGVRALIRWLAARRNAAAFGVLCVLAVVWGGPSALEGLPRFLSALTPGMAQAGPAPSVRVARLTVTGLEPSSADPQILYPVPRNPFPDWMTHVRPKPAPVRDPVIAICIDDLGEDLVGTRRAMALPRAVALAFLPFAETTPFLADEARTMGHTVLAHVPMRAMRETRNYPMMLSPEMERDEILRRLYWSLSRVPGLSGVNNHEGSLFTADAAALRPVMETLKARNLFFFDSRTSPRSQGLAVADAVGVPSVGRDIFLDDDRSEAAVRAQLAALLATAKRQGVAIAIGHPHDVTLRLVAEWLKQDHGVKLVTLEVAMKMRNTQASRLAAR